MNKSSGKKKRQASSSDSDSSEDDLMTLRLKECVAETELQKKEVVKSEKKLVLSSKRPDLNKDVEVLEDGESTHVTPEFQEFVGKKLRAKMDDLIEMVEFENKKKKKKKKDKFERIVEDSGDGFSFFNGVLYKAQENVDGTKDSCSKKSKKSKKKVVDSSSDEESKETLAMLNEAAVQVTNISKSNTGRLDTPKKALVSKKSKKKVVDSSSDEESKETLAMLNEAAVQVTNISKSNTGRVDTPIKVLDDTVDSEVLKKSKKHKKKHRKELTRSDEDEDHKKIKLKVS